MSPFQRPFRISAASRRAGILSFACLLVLASGAVEGRSGDEPSSPRPHEDPARIVGPRECGECHEKAVGVWMESRHYVGSMELTRDPKAKEIASALGIRRVKSDARCTTCHYTVQQHGAKTKAIAGVSCESCHGAAIEWIELHDQFGSTEATVATETPEHRARRLAACDDAGMMRADSIAGIGSRCHTCHTISDEELINVGGHPVPNSLELVAWTQGEVRHNYVRSQGEVNEESSIERRRLMFVIGQCLQIEFALRALALAEADGDFVAETRARAETSIAALRDAVKRGGLETLAALLGELDGLVLAAGGGETLTAAADRIHGRTIELESELAEVDLSHLDELLPGAGAYRGSVR